MSRWSNTPEPVDAFIIRRAFNDGEYHERSLHGEFIVTIVWDREADLLRSGEPAGTRSQIILYERGDVAIALVHQYQRPDGTIGGSGRPDPKVLTLDDGRVIRVRA